MSPNLLGAIISVYTFFLVIFFIFTIYVIYYHGDILKNIIQRHQDDLSSSLSSQIILFESPVPGAKRLSQILKDIRNQHITLEISNE